MSRGALTNNYAGDCWLVRVEQIAGAVLFIGGVDAQSPAIREEIAPDPALRAEFDAAYERFRQAYPAIRAAQ